MQKLLHLNRSYLIRNSSIFNRTNHNVPSSNMKHDLTKPTYDVVIFGASGFTGKYVVKEALKFLNSPNSPLKTLALAGRNHSKLSEALAWAAPSHYNTTIPFLLADTNDPPSLRRMVSQAKLRAGQEGVRGVRRLGAQTLWGPKHFIFYIFHVIKVFIYKRCINKLHKHPVGRVVVLLL
ncbi:putative NAD(P)-binding domain superfamily [Helianthus anomalus]